MPKFIFTWTTYGSTTIEAESLEEARVKWDIYELSNEAEFETGIVLQETSSNVFDEVDG